MNEEINENTPMKWVFGTHSHLSNSIYYGVLILNGIYTQTYSGVLVEKLKKIKKKIKIIITNKKEQNKTKIKQWMQSSFGERTERNENRATFKDTSAWMLLLLLLLLEQREQLSWQMAICSELVQLNIFYVAWILVCMCFRFNSSQLSFVYHTGERSQMRHANNHFKYFL